MKFSFFYHSLVSDWSHPSAHFLRGVLTDLIARGHHVHVYEPIDGYSRANLLQHHGLNALDQFYNTYPHLVSFLYDRQTLNMEKIAAESDVIIVHDWNESWVINGFGELRNRLQAGNNVDQTFQLFFHDTQPRAFDKTFWLTRLKLDFYDGILAYENTLADVYRTHGFDNVWTLHQAADTRVFYPRESSQSSESGDVVWFGSWGDDNHTRALKKYLFDPVNNLRLTCNMYGIHYAYDAVKKREMLGSINNGCIKDHGWLASFNTPAVYANHSAAVHVPYCDTASNFTLSSTTQSLEAMACGIPLISAQYSSDIRAGIERSSMEPLFTPGEDFLVAHNTAEVQRHLYAILHDPDYARHLADKALRTVLNRHTCTHRVNELLSIIDSVDNPDTEDHFTVQSGAINNSGITGDSTRMYN